MKELVGKLRGRKVLVLGDMTFDKYTTGRVTRISPEAPVPMVEVESESYHLGGAANVLSNLCALGGEVATATAVGDDPEGTYLVREIGKMGVGTEGVFREGGRMTTIVNRILTPNGHQLLRLDRAEDKKIGREIAAELTDYVRGAMGGFDLLLIADYGRGIITQELVGNVVGAARGHGKKIVVNPKRENFMFYEGVDVIRTNFREAGFVTKVSATDEAGLLIMGEKLLNSLRCGAVLITWIEEGFHLFEQGGKRTFIPPLVKRPLDVTGVGDAITCTLALGLAAGASLEDSAKLANYAGAIVANKRGLANVKFEELEEALERGVPQFQTL